MSLAESSGTLTRWRLRLAEYDFTIQYHPARVHQVPDSLSRVISPRAAVDPRRAVEVDDDIITFDVRTTVRGVSEEQADYTCTAECDHRAVQVLVTTRKQTETRRRTGARVRDEPRGDEEASAPEKTDAF